jgi:hypothetical protein
MILARFYTARVDEQRQLTNFVLRARVTRGGLVAQNCRPGWYRERYFTYGISAMSLSAWDSSPMQTLESWRKRSPVKSLPLVLDFWTPKQFQTCSSIPVAKARQ